MTTTLIAQHDDTTLIAQVLTKLFKNMFYADDLEKFDEFARQSLMLLHGEGHVKQTGSLDVTQRVEGEAALRHVTITENRSRT